VVTLFVAPAVYAELTIGLAALNSHTLVNEMFQDGSFGLSWSLILYVPYKFLVTAVSVTLPLPVGLFTPVFLTGGVIGRVFGELLNWLQEEHGLVTSYHPWEFAVIGAAAFSTGAVRAISTAVIVFELSGATHMRVPLGVALLCAHYLGSRFTRSVYEVLIDTNGTPFLPELPSEAYGMLACEVMRPLEEIPFLSFETTYAELRELMDHRIKEEVVPVVQSHQSMVIVGAVLREDLARAVRKLFSYQKQIRMTPIVLGLTAEELSASPGQEGAGPEEEEEEPWGGARPGAVSIFAGGMRHSESDPGAGNGRGMISAAPPHLALDPEAQRIFAAEARGGASGYGATSERGWTRARSNSDPLAEVLASTLNFVVMMDGGRKAVPVVSYVPQHTQHRRGVTLLPEIPLDRSPYQIVDTMQLNKVDLVFRLLKLNTAYVTKNGRLEGLITRALLRDFIGQRAKRPIDRCIQLMNALCRCLGRGDYQPVR